MLTDRSRKALSLCSSLAIATALIVGSSAARAQSFQGNGTFASGGGTITTGTGTTTIDLATNDAVIDWTTFDTAIGGGPIDFQPSGTTATFQRISDFSVLNRILPTDPSRAIQFNGNIIAQIQGTSTMPGGTVYFYSPGGVIVGSTAVFNVGNLGLTSAAPQVVGGIFEQDNGLGSEFVNFTTANPGTAVTIQAGAQINSSAPGNGSYIAIVAPRVTNSGTLDVSRGAALVSADAATITLNINGLLDIQVTSGTSATGATLVNTGTITGPAASGGFANRIYLVAVPKNDAITMVIADGSSLGFNIAGAADVVGNAVILSGGHDVVGGDVATARSAGGGTGSVVIDAFNADFTSDVRGRATGRAIFASDGSVGAAGMSFAAGVDVHSDTQVSLEARNNGPLDVVGNVFLDAHVIATANGAAATGGLAYLDARNGADLTVGGSVFLSAAGNGATSTSPGVLSTGNGTGGSASLSATLGGSIAIAGNVGLDASGHAGSTGVAGVDGGNGTGGTVNVFVSGSGSSIGIGGDLSAFAYGFGGDGNGCTTCGDDGGIGQGGQILVQAASGPAQITITGNVDLDSSGFGGNSLSTLAGAGIGGRSNIGTNIDSTISIGGTADLYAYGFGGDDLAASGPGGGGSGTGGLAEFGTFQGGTLTLGSAISADASGFGGDSSAVGTAAGAGIGGIAQFYQDTSGTINAGSDADFFAYGFGGDASVTGVTGGNGTGGEARAIAYNAGTSALSITGSLFADASGFGGFGDCTACTLSGGQGTGGNARLGADAAGKTFAVAGATQLIASGFGGPGTAAIGRGGSAIVNATDSTIALQSGVFLFAHGSGGSHLTGGLGGDGLGGGARIETFGTSGGITVTGDASLSSDSFGGDSNGAGGTGGNAGQVGGSGSAIRSNAGTIAVSGDAFVSSAAFGGSGAANGGNAQGGFANARALGGDVSIGGNLSTDASAFGGDGGQGGTGTGGTNTIDAANGDLAAASLNGTVLGFGGNGAAGGAGGDGTGGSVVVFAANSLSGPSSVTLQNLFAAAQGHGGFGSTGLNPGDPGGAGGDGTGGFVGITAGAGNGTLTALDVFASADGIGGDGGAGADNLSAIGGAGGAGGNAIGGSVTVGTQSHIDTPDNTGSASYGNVLADSSASGGGGGAGGAGTTQGVGGAGGDAAGGGAILLVRGSPVTVGGDVNLLASAFGGAGGTGSTQGVGGDAVIGFDSQTGIGGTVGVVVTNRFQFPAQPGSLTANIFASAQAVGGVGSVSGTSTRGSQAALFEVTNSTVDANGVSFFVEAAQNSTGALPDLITLTNATVDAIGSFSFFTSGDLTLALDNSTLDVANLLLDAGNFVLPAVAPTVAGTINTNTISLFTAGRFATYANIVGAGDLLLDTTGGIQTGNLSFGGALSLSSNGSILIGNLSAAGVDLITDLDLTTGTIGSSGGVNGEAGTTLTTGAVTATEGVDLESAGALTAGAITSGQSVFLTSDDSTVTAGNIVAGNDPITQFSMGIVGTGAVSVGNLTGSDTIAILSRTGSINAGAVSTPSSVLALAGGSVNLGNVTTGNGANNYLYIADASMVTLGGPLDDFFDPAPIFAATPVAISGPITINGPVTTGIFQAATTQAFTSGAIAASSSLEIDAGLAIMTGALSAVQDIALSSGSSLTLGAITTSGGLFLDTGGALTTGNLQALEIGLLAAQGITTGTLMATLEIELDAGGAVLSGAITAGQSASLAAGSTLTAGNITAGSDPSSQFSIALVGGGAVNVGNLTGTGTIGILSQTGSLTAQNITTGTSLLALASGAVNLGGVTTGATGNLYIANASMASLGGALDETFNPAPIFAATPTRTGGPITINGGVTSGNLKAATAQGITVQAVTAGTPAFPGSIDIDAGGLATVNGRLASARIDIASGDIDITATGSLDALTATGEIQLASNNPAGMLVGDGLSGNGYALSNAEYGRLRAGEIAIVGDDMASLATDMTIGNLSISVNQLYGPNGTAQFATGNRATSTPGGGLRINGAINATGFAATNTLEFLTGTFELEAAAGLVNVTGSGNALGGIVLIDAARIHVASDAILTKLRADPLYAGHAAELNAPATVQRPDGVLRALGIELFPRNTLYIQNTGTVTTPAGFFTTFDNTEVELPATPPTGGVEVIINGQFQTTTGTITGRDAYQAVLDSAEPGEMQFEGFSATSQLNGCTLLGGVCGQSFEMDPVAALSSEITVVTSAQLDESPVAPTADDSDEGEDGSSDKDEDDSDSDEGSSPIAPPTPLISTRALDGDVTVVEPVSGAGNPALFGSAVNETTVQGETP